MKKTIASGRQRNSLTYKTFWNNFLTYLLSLRIIVEAPGLPGLLLLHQQQVDEQESAKQEPRSWPHSLRRLSKIIEKTFNWKNNQYGYIYIFI